MKILFTGASSFTGMWFVKELAEAGHEVTATFLREREDYEDLRRTRMEKALQWCQPIFSCPFGSECFLETIEETPHWDLLCHHAADVTGYKNPDFNFAKALANNTKNITYVLESLKNKGCRKILLTGSVFEQREGQGSDQLRAVSPYGLSKGLTADVFNYFCQVFSFKLGKFVIPNPFGPYEEPRFTTFLIKSWFSGQTPAVKTPEYTRDNIPVSLMAKAYCHFAESLKDEPGYEALNPSYFSGKQGEFTTLFAKEMEKYLAIPCKVELKTQAEFSEPQIRVNTDPLNPEKLGWDADTFWKEMATFYKEHYGTK